MWYAWQTYYVDIWVDLINHFSDYIRLIYCFHNCIWKLFKNLEAFDRKPPEKSIVQRVADAYEMLGLLEEKQRVLEKYNDLFTENKSPKKGRISPYKKKKK